MSDTTMITPEKRKMFREDASFVVAHEKKNLERVGAAEAIVLLLDALEQAEAMVDWLANQAADICADAYPKSEVLRWWEDSNWIEAARRAVAAGEG